MAKTPLQASSHDHEHHVVPTKTYLAVLAFLTVMMLLTIYAATVDIPSFLGISGTVLNQTVALLIAIAKAFAVVWIFMGVKWGTKLTKIWAVTGFVWVLLLGLIVIDYPMRAFETVEGWEGQVGRAGHGRDGSALPRVVTPSGDAQNIEENEVNLRPRQ